ncbi:hypothetical protein [Soonwooa sp.]|uniref:hypothetical protein n=1 Tax=Soonwooa sp. TaxID=1938592 RepID=UPI0026159442|nr:hypothetical protein [Soonwooa sp.]
MNFRRRTKSLTGIPAGLYVVLALLVISFFWANSHFTHPEAGIPPDTIDSLVSVPQSSVEEPTTDSLSKPDIYIPDVAVKPMTDSIPAKVEPQKEVLKEKLEDKKEDKVVDKKEDQKKKKDEEDKKSNDPKKTKIGSDRKLISFIPGTMGNAGKLPSNNCKTKGELTMNITINEAGNVISAGRSKGISEPCAVTAAVIWLKKYVKAEKKANETSTGTYTIKF